MNSWDKSNDVSMWFGWEVAYDEQGSRIKDKNGLYKQVYRISMVNNEHLKRAEKAIKARRAAK